MKALIVGGDHVNTYKTSSCHKATARFSIGQDERTMNAIALFLATQV